MGAGATQRGDETAEIVSVRREFMTGLYAQLTRYKAATEDARHRANIAEKDLLRAQSLIARLRAENEVLKEEKCLFITTVDNTRRHIDVAGNSHRKWAVDLVKTQLEKARLI